MRCLNVRSAGTVGLHLQRRRWLLLCLVFGFAYGPFLLFFSCFCLYLLFKIFSLGQILVAVGKFLAIFFGWKGYF